MRMKSKTLGELYDDKKFKPRRKKIDTTRIYLSGIISGLVLAIIVVGIYVHLFM